MSSNSKNSFRYFYWIFTAFFSKNIQYLVVSFIITTVFAIVFTIVSPYFLKSYLLPKTIVGYENKPDILEIQSTLPNQLLENITNSLVVSDEKGGILPRMAESYNTSNDNKLFTFILKKDLNWSDGSPLLAKDLIQFYVFKNVNVTATDDRTLKFSLKEPANLFPFRLTRKIVKLNNKQSIVGIGGKFIASKTKIKNGFFDEIEIRQANQKSASIIIIYKFYENEDRLVNAYKSGEIKSFETSNKKLYDVFSNWKNTMVEKRPDYSSVQTLFFNTNTPIFGKDKKDSRKAVIMSIDRSQLAKNGDLAFSPLPPTSWAYTSDTKQIPYNQEMAEKTYAKNESSTDSANLRPLSIVAPYEQNDIAIYIQKSLKDIKVNSNISFLTKRNLESFDILIQTLKISNEPDQYIYWHSIQTIKNGGLNITGFNNMKIDKILEDGRKTIDPNARKDYYDKFQKIMMDEVPAYFLYHPYIYTITRKNSNSVL